MARPPKPINWDMVIKWMEAGCTQNFIARQFNIHPKNFIHKFKQEFGCSFVNFVVDFTSDGKENIKAVQYFKAIGLTQKGDNKMLELLGKEWLGQGRDEVKESPLEEILTIRHENMILRAELNELKDTINANKPQAGQELSGSDSSI